MSTTMSAREANQHFSRLLRQVQSGGRVIVTSRGRPVAQVTGIVDAPDEQLEARKRRFVARLRRTHAMALPPWTRAELYD